MAGVAYGTPDEFSAQGRIMDFIPKWEPNQAAMSINNDDLYVQMTFAAVLDQAGLACIPGNAAGVLGVIMGYDKIPGIWKAGIPKVMDTKFLYTEFTLRDVVAATEKHALALIKRSGGRVTDAEVIIPGQNPEAARFEQWPAGVPSQLVFAKDGGWSWKGNWKETPDGKAAAGPGNEVTLKFKGSAVAVIGPLSQEGGRAEVFVDGKKSPYILDAYIGPDTHDNILWHTYGLGPGEHTLRIVILAQADARSRGRKIIIEKAVIYRVK